MNKKNTWVKRTKKAFILAAHEIIESEGFDKVSIRKVAERTGYNSSSLYNYFENLDQLLYMASIKYTQGYLERLIAMAPPENACIRYLNNWQCFAEEALKQPIFYYRVFFTSNAAKLNAYLHEYYAMFPEAMADEMLEMLPALEADNAYRRDIECLNACVEEGFIDASEMYQLNDICMLICQGLLSQIIDGGLKESHEKIVTRFVSNIEKVLSK